MSGRIQISSQNFFRRVKHFYSHWKDPKKEFKDAETIIIENGKNEEASIKVKTAAFYLWLFGQELIDSLLLFTKKTVFIVVSSAHSSLVETLNTPPEDFELEISIIIKDESKNTDLFDKLKSTIQGESTEPVLKFGRLLKDKQQGPFAQETEQFISSLAPEFIEIGALIQDTLAIKEGEELELIKKAGCVAVWFQNKVIGEVENIIDNEKKVKHSDISKEITKLLENDSEMKNLETTQKVERRFVDLAYDPIIQSGGVYDLKAQAESTAEYLGYDTIICSVGSKYHNYCCNIVRTLFIDPDHEQNQNYVIAYEAQNNVIAKLKPGTSLKAVYDSTFELIKSKKESLLHCIPTSFGYGIGLEFRENNLNISSKNDRVVEAGMTFNVTVTLNRLKAKNGNDYAIMISDTVIIKSTGPEVITQKIPRKYEEISYSLKGDEEPKEPSRKDTKVNTSSKGRGRNVESKKSENDENKRKDHQKQLQEQKLNELRERIASGGIVGDKAKQKIDAEKLNTYRSINDLPKDMKKNQVYVDMKNDSVIVPIYGQMVPFHINVIKNVSKQEDDKKVSSLRLNFHVPTAQSGSNMIYPEMKDQNVCFIRELTFRSKNSKNMADVVKKIKDLQKKIKDKQNEEKHSIWDPESDPLVMIKGKKPFLSDLKVRPNISGKKSTGNLEAHANGFRFITKKGEKLDITFRNIKHAFFQPCDNELIILLHFNLEKPIMIGKKRTYDVQFYTEAGLQAEDLDMRRRGNDDDEIEAEEREKAQRKKLNEEFEAFTKAVESAARDQIEFDIPYRELGFQGAPSKACVNLYPTVHCLVNLTDAPFFIMTLEEVEIAHFERIQYGLKNFDLTFVYKDYSKPVTRVCAIPIQFLDPIKNWLDKMDIVFSESTVNLDWSKVIAEVREQIKNNAEEFLADGGWGFLQPGDSDDEDMEGEEEENDSAFEAGEDESEDFSDEDDDEEDEEESEFDDDISDEDADELDEDEEDEEEEEEEDSREARRKKQIKNPIPPKKVKK